MRAKYTETADISEWKSGRMPSFGTGRAKKIRYKQNRKQTQIKKLSASGQWRAKQAEHQKSSVRAKAEHVFAVIKGQFRYRKTRYRGLSKQTAKLNMLFALANLVLADRLFPAV